MVNSCLFFVYYNILWNVEFVRGVIQKKRCFLLDIVQMWPTAPWGNFCVTKQHYLKSFGMGLNPLKPYFRCKQGQGNQCQAPGVEFESPVLQSNFSFGDKSVLVIILFNYHLSFGDISVLVTFLLWKPFCFSYIEFWWHLNFGNISVSPMFFVLSVFVFCIFHTFLYFL